METKKTDEKVIEIKDLYKSFGDNHVLRGVDLELHRGENVVVLGRSGTGKSVLIKIISGLLVADSGVVNVIGQDVETLDTKQLDELRLKIGFSFQNSALYDSMTVRENLAFPLERHSRKMTLADYTNRKSIYNTFYK
jgi:phospholipid/cholesterol/gamma-HCH transport system ATP-binding protein